MSAPHFISGQLVRGDEISCSRVYVVPFSAASFACRRAFNLVVFSSVWTGAPFALTGCFVTAAKAGDGAITSADWSEAGVAVGTLEVTLDGFITGRERVSAVTGGRGRPDRVQFAFDEDYPMVEPGKVDSLQLVMGRYEHVQPWDFALT